MASYDNRTVFASGPQGTSRVDSLTSANGSIWAEYGNGADSAGARGSSTLVKYAQNGMLELSLTLPGSVMGSSMMPRMACSMPCRTRTAIPR